MRRTTLFAIAAAVVILVVIAIAVMYTNAGDADAEGYAGTRFGYYGAHGRYGRGQVAYGKRFHPQGRDTYGYPVYPGRYTRGGYAQAPYGSYYSAYGPFYRPYRPYYLPHAGWW